MYTSIQKQYNYSVFIIIHYFIQQGHIKLIVKVINKTSNKICYFKSSLFIKNNSSNNPEK